VTRASSCLGQRNRSWAKHCFFVCLFCFFGKKKKEKSGQETNQLVLHNTDSMVIHVADSSLSKDNLKKKGERGREADTCVSGGNEGGCGRGQDKDME